MSTVCITSFLQQLEQGQVRAASLGPDQTWTVNPEIKAQILEIFRLSPTVEMNFGCIDKEALSPRVFRVSDGIRIAPSGSCVRAGAHVGKGVVIMPPSYINIGAYVDEDTMVDSHVLVGSCAQIGKRVHLSVGVSIGGVLEPVEALPVIIEDHVFVGAGCAITSGFHVAKNAVLGSGLHLSRSIPVYDVVHNTVYHGYIPENAVVVPGTRSIAATFQQVNLALNCGIIIKYRDASTSAHTALEDALRS